MTTQSRRLAAIMFTDIVGYTALMGSDEDKAFEILRKNREIHIKFIDKFNGTLIKEMGDGMLVSFNLAADAVYCAIEIQKKVKDELHAQVRIGIHSGDITFENEDVFGDGVNLASRLQSITDPGGIYISESLQKSIRSKSDIETKYLGEFNLKNVDYPVRTYAVQGGELPVPSKEKIKELSGKSLKQRIFGSTISYIIFFILLLPIGWVIQYGLLKDKPTLLILTPENNTGIDTIPHIISGIHTSLIGEVGKIGELNIISPYTSKTYKDSGKSLKEIAKETKANYIAQPALSCIGDNVCLNFIMPKIGSKEKQIWSEDFHKEKRQIFDMYNQITKEIAGKINIVLSPEDERLLAKSRDVDPEAYDAYLKSLQFIGDASLTSLNKAIEQLNYAIKKDPDWAQLYSGLASAWLTYLHMGHASPSIAIPIIYENINKALELDPDLPDAHGLRAMIAQLMEWNWEKSEKEFLRTLAINPSAAITRIFYAQYLSTMQRPDEALIQGQLAYELDPLNPMMKCWFGALLTMDGDCKTSLTVAEEVLVSDPDHYLANSLIAESAFQCKDYDRVFEADMNSMKNIFEADSISKIRKIFKEKGYIEANEEFRNQLEAYEENNLFGPVGMAIFYIRWNLPDKAMDWLEKGYEMHDTQMIYITTKIYHFEPLFDNPRFLKIVKEMNLPLPKN